MNTALRTLVAGAAGSVVTIAVVVGQPALAGPAEKAHGKQVTSAMIKNGTIKRADLGVPLNASLAKADSALQGIADGSVSASKLAANAVTGGTVADNTLTGSDVNESTLGQVPDAARLGGRAATAFATSTVYRAESTVDAGTRLGDNTNVKTEACNTGDILLSGGPANLSATTDLVESFPSPGSLNSWSARINDNGTADNFSIVVLCLDQTP